MLYDIPTAFGQTDTEPEIVPGVAGTGIDVKAVQVFELLPQLLEDFTQIFPLIKEEKLTVIEFVEEVPEAPVGNVHI
jgi:hypothetical protein